MAHTGSYARRRVTIRQRRCAPALQPAASSALRASAPLHAAAVSPIQIIGRNPACNARSALDATTASVSPCHWRRSECPTMTQPQPPSRSISAAMSPYRRPDAPIRPALRSRPESVQRQLIQIQIGRAHHDVARRTLLRAANSFNHESLAARPVHFPVCSDQRTTRIIVRARRQHR